MNDIRYWRDKINQIIAESDDDDIPVPPSGQEIKLNRIYRQFKQGIVSGHVKIEPQAGRFLYVTGFNFSLGGIDNIYKITVDIINPRPTIYMVSQDDIPRVWWRSYDHEDLQLIADVLENIMHIIGFPSITNLNPENEGSNWLGFEFYCSKEDQDKMIQMVKQGSNLKETDDNIPAPPSRSDIKRQQLRRLILSNNQTIDYTITLDNKSPYNVRFVIENIKIPLPDKRVIHTVELRYPALSSVYVSPHYNTWTEIPNDKTDPSRYVAVLIDELIKILGFEIDVDEVDPFYQNYLGAVTLDVSFTPATQDKINSLIKNGIQYKGQWHG